MGVEKSKLLKRVPLEGGNNPIASLGFEQMDVDDLVGVDASEDEGPVIISEHIVGGWVRWEERKFRRHTRHYIAHLTILYT